ncbi:MAG: hypothetical protein Q4F63_05225 [Clostridia bacterium]|nr:hypothetical protein [Clostridia bacterium]
MKAFVLIFCLSIFGINIGNVEKAENVKTEYIPYGIYVKSDRDKALLEGDKCMSGVYIWEENIYSDIKNFEEKTLTSNDIYISRLIPGEDFPKGEIIDCYAKGKQPMLIIEKGFGSSQIMKAAEICGNINIPLFVEIKDNDKEVYECFAEIFREYAPRSVMVYGIDSADNVDMFPDENLVDWIAIEAKEKMKNGIIMSEYENISSKCNYFKNKTLMLNISVPNFSIEKCNYAYNEAANEISRLYSLALDYGNVGAVNYISIIEKNENTVSCNYRITENQIITEAFKRGVEGLEKDRYWTLTPYAAYVWGSNVIVSNECVKSLGLKGEFVNSGFSKIKASGFNKSERKVFVNS